MTVIVLPDMMPPGDNFPPALGSPCDAAHQDWSTEFYISSRVSSIYKSTPVPQLCTAQLSNGLPPTASLPVGINLSVRHSGSLSLCLSLSTSISHSVHISVQCLSSVPPSLSFSLTLCICASHRPKDIYFRNLFLSFHNHTCG